MLINSEVKIVDFIRCVLSKLFWYGQSLYKVSRIPVMYRDSWEVTSYAVFLLETRDYVFVFDKDCIKLLRESVIEISWNRSFTSQ